MHHGQLILYTLMTCSTRFTLSAFCTSILPYSPSLRNELIVYRRGREKNNATGLKQITTTYLSSLNYFCQPSQAVVYMDFRRQTLASNGGSSHPQPLVPSSAVKKVGRLGPARQSLAPSQIQSRTSILGVSNSQENAPHGMMGSKKSTMPGKMGDRDQLMSASRGDGGMYGRTPQMNRGIPGR